MADETDDDYDAADGASSPAPPSAPAKPRTKYRFLEKAGSGSYGIVYKALQVESSRIVAIKRIRKEGDEGIPSNTLREITVLRELGHANIIGLLDVEVTPSEIFLVFEWADTDLDRVLQRFLGPSVPLPASADARSAPPEGLSVADIRCFTRQLLSGLAFLHARGVLHRDIKPANLLLCDSSPAAGGGGSASALPLSLRIADFGLARGYASANGTPAPGAAPGSRPAALGGAPEFTHEVVTLWYRAPELLLGSRDYAAPVDVWAAGAVLGEMASGAPLWPAESEVGMLMAIFKALGTPGDDVWPGVSRLPDWLPAFPRFPVRPDRWARLAPRLPPDGHSLLSGLLELDPGKRLTARAALAHPFLAEAR